MGGLRAVSILSTWDITKLEDVPGGGINVVGTDDAILNSRHVELF